MSAVEWSFEARRAAFTATAYAQPSKGIVTVREAILEALVPHVEAMLRQARAEALRDAHVAFGEDGLTSANLYTALLDRAEWEESR